MISPDYVKQLEAANEELQRKLEDSDGKLEKLKNERNGYRLVVVCSEDIIKAASPGPLGDIEYKASLIVVPVSREEKLKVYENYQISPDVRLTLFKSVKDRNNKIGSFYDSDMLKDYSNGRTVNPYVI